MKIGRHLQLALRYGLLVTQYTLLVCLCSKFHGGGHLTLGQF
jgi:hypothetical protein